MSKRKKERPPIEYALKRVSGDDYVVTEAVTGRVVPFIVLQDAEHGRMYFSVFGGYDRVTGKMLPLGKKVLESRLQFVPGNVTIVGINELNKKQAVGNLPSDPPQSEQLLPAEDASPITEVTAMDTRIKPTVNGSISASPTVSELDKKSSEVEETPNPSPSPATEKGSKEAPPQSKEAFQGGHSDADVPTEISTLLEVDIELGDDPIPSAIGVPIVVPDPALALPARVFTVSKWKSEARLQDEKFQAKVFRRHEQHFTTKVACQILSDKLPEVTLHHIRQAVTELSWSGAKFNGSMLTMNTLEKWLHNRSFCGLVQGELLPDVIELPAPKVRREIQIGDMVKDGHAEYRIVLGTRREGYDVFWMAEGFVKFDEIEDVRYVDFPEWELNSAWVRTLQTHHELYGEKFHEYSHNKFRQLAMLGLVELQVLKRNTTTKRGGKQTFNVFKVQITERGKLFLEAKAKDNPVNCFPAIHPDLDKQRAKQFQIDRNKEKYAGKPALAKLAEAGLVLVEKTEVDIARERLVGDVKNRRLGKRKVS